MPELIEVNREVVGEVGEVVLIESLKVYLDPPTENMMLYLKSPLLERWAQGMSEGRQVRVGWEGTYINIYTFDAPIIDGCVWTGTAGSKLITDRGGINLIPFLVVGIGEGVNLPLGPFLRKSEVKLWEEALRKIIPDLYLEHINPGSFEMKFTVEVTRGRVA